MSAPQPREDILVSVCFAELPATEPSLTALQLLARQLATQYRYWEILIAVMPDESTEREALMLAVGNVRLLKVRHGTPFYRCRAVVAAEAIGDVVLLAAIEDCPSVNVIEMIEKAVASDGIVIGRRPHGGFLNPLMQVLGRSAGFRADGRGMLTAAFPRPMLNQLLVHPDRQLALRFPPVDAGIVVTWQPSRSAGAQAYSQHNIGRRLKLVHRLLISSAPRVLTLVALLALLVTASGIAFSIYAVVVWLTLASVQPGWFTTSFVLGLTATFLGLAVFGLSIGIQTGIESLAGNQTDDVVDERSAVDLFDQVMTELNVDLQASKEPGLSATRADRLDAGGT